MRSPSTPGTLRAISHIVSSSGPGDLVIVAQPDAILAKDRADGLDVAGIPRVQHPVEALLRVEDVFQTSAEMGMRRAVSGDHAVVEGLVADVGETGEAEFLAGEGDEFFAFGAANLVRGFFQAGPHGAGIEADEAKIDGVLTERHVTDRAVCWIVVGAHAGAGEIDHELVEFPAGGADVIIFDGLRHVDDFHAVGEGDGIYVQEREHQVDARAMPSGTCRRRGYCRRGRRRSRGSRLNPSRRRMKSTP